MGAAPLSPTDHSQYGNRPVFAPSSAEIASSSPRGWFERWWSGGWLHELLIIAFSAALNVALCVVLHHYEGRPLPMFGTLLNSGVTLNTVVSLLATFSVAASMLVVEESLGQLKWLWYAERSRPLTDIETYDKASRGTLGSLQLLWKLRLRCLPSTGALLIVVHLIIAPLTQQSVLTTLTSIPSDNEVALAHRNNLWNTSVGTENVIMPGGYNRINATMKGAVLNGLFFDSAVMPEVEPTCTSGNCSFPLYHSLSICSSVADVSSSLTQAVVRPGTANDSSVMWCLPGDHCLNATGPTPTLAWVRSAAGPHAGDSWQLGEHLTMLNYTSVAFSDRRAPIADFYLIYRNTTHKGFESTDTIRPVEDLKYSAMELVLDWCIPTFNISVQNGVATTTRLSDVFREFNVPDNLDPHTGSVKPISGVVNGTLYRVDQFTHDSLQRYMWTLLSGDIDAPGNLDQPTASFNLSFTNSDPAQAVWATTQIDGGDQWDDGIHQVPSSDLAVEAARRMLNNTATSMSNNIRKQSNQASHPGTATVTQNIVTIEWGYVGVLIGFTGASFIFLLIVMVVGNKRTPRRPERLPVLKSSTFALVRCLDPALQQVCGGMRLEGRMAEDASSMRVQLIAEADGSWKLIPSRPKEFDGTNTLQISRPFRSSSNLPNDGSTRKGNTVVVQGVMI